MSKNKLFSVFVICVLVMSQASFAAGGEYGTLKVVTDDENAEIYVDGAMAGYYVVTIEKILVGSHYVQVKLDGKSIYSQMVSVQKGKQITVVASLEGTRNFVGETETMPAKNKLFPLVYEVTYGGYNINYYIEGLAGTPSSTTNTLGIGLGLKKYIEQESNLYYIVGFHYNNKILSDQLSYLFLNVGNENQTGFTELGINYCQWQNDAMGVSGTVGYQIAIGFNSTKNITWGIKYAVFNGGFNYLGYSGNVTFAQPMVFVRIQ